MIKVFSTYTKDLIYNLNRDKKFAKQGGPAFFIENVFQKNKIAYTLKAQKAIVKIKIKNGIEKGALEGALKPRVIENIRKNENVLVSTVDKEWMLSDEILDKARIFLDVQGYVRSAKKNPILFKANFWNSIYCMKANDGELKELPGKIVAMQKKKLLIVTKGEEGATIYTKGKKHNIKGSKIKAPDYIGSGDTFFAEFIGAIVKNNFSIIKSGNFAIREVEKFLLSKNEKIKSS